MDKFVSKEAGTSFFEKKAAKKLLAWGPGSLRRHGLKEQKFFAEAARPGIFFENATA
jgi:hypothetical protein